VDSPAPLPNWLSGGTASTPTFTQGYNSLNTYSPIAWRSTASGLQHEIVPALILVTQYVGNIDWHQNTWLPINNYPLSTPPLTRLDTRAITQISPTGATPAACPSLSTVQKS